MPLIQCGCITKNETVGYCHLFFPIAPLGIAFTMNLVNYLQFLEPVQEHVTRIYSTTSEIITIFLILWCINFVAGLIQKTFATGQAFGRFYHSYLHGYTKSGIKSITSLVNRKRNLLIESRGTSYPARPIP